MTWHSRLELSAEAVGRLADAILAAEPSAHEAIRIAAGSGQGLTARLLAQGWWPDVDVLWVVVGDGPRAFARYLAVTPGGAIVVLTCAPVRFSEVAQVTVEEAEVTDYALFFYEVTRGLDVPEALVGPAPDWLDDRRRELLERALAEGDAVFRRLARYRARGGEDHWRALARVLEAQDETDPLEVARRLPPATLTAEERRLLREAHPFSPHGGAEPALELVADGFRVMSAGRPQSETQGPLSVAVIEPTVAWESGALDGVQRDWPPVVHAGAGRWWLKALVAAGERLYLSRLAVSPDGTVAEQRTRLI